MRRRTLACVALTAVLVLTGCKASGDDAAAPAKGSTGEVTAANAPISAEALCAHLKKEAPRIEAVGSEVGAMAQLTVSISNLYEDHLDRLDGSVLDEQASKTCPDTRAALLKASGIKSFSEL